jgi:hypothetical protein
MKRNKRTEIMAHDDLAPLTEQILTKMGQEGEKIRKRLKKFYRNRNHQDPPLFEEVLEGSSELQRP